MKSVFGITAFVCHCLIVALCVAGPVCLFGGSLFDADGITLQHWKNAFADSARVFKLLGTSSWIVLIALLVSVPTGTIVAAILFRYQIPLGRTFLVLLLFATTVPLHVTMTAVFAITGIQELQYCATAVGLIHGIHLVPLTALIVGVGLANVDRESEELALVEGMSPLRVLSIITLRQSRGALVIAALLVVLFTLTDYSVSDVLLVRSYAEEVYTQYAIHGRPEEPSLSSLPQLVLIALVLWLSRGALVRLDVEAQLGRSPLRFRPGRHGLLVLLTLLGLLGATVLLPVFLLVDLIGSSKSPWYYLSLYVSEIWTSLWTALSAGLLCAFLACGLAWYFVRQPRWRWAIGGACVLLLATPAPVLGIGLIRLLNGPVLGWLAESPATLVLSYTARFLPLAGLLVIPAFGAIAAEQERVARLDGARGVDLWWHIVLPQCRWHATLAGLVVMVLAVGELPVSFLTAPPGHRTVAGLFFDSLHYGLADETAALCLISMLVVVGPCAGLLLLLQRRETRQTF